MSQWQNNSNSCVCLYRSNSSVQQADSQVNNCSMCPPWTWTTTFNRGDHWSTIRIEQQVHLLAFEDLKLQISLSDSSHKTVGYSWQLFDISGTFAGLRVVFLTAYQFSYTLDILFHSNSPQPSATGLPRDQVRCVNLAQKISNRTDSPFAPNPFSWQRNFIDNFIFICERHVYQQTVM